MKLWFHPPQLNRPYINTWLKLPQTQGLRIMSECLNLRVGSLVQLCTMVKKQNVAKEKWSGQVQRSREIMLPQGGKKSATWVADEFLVPGSPPLMKPICTSIFKYCEIPRILAININSCFFKTLVSMWFVTNKRNLILKTSKKKRSSRNIKMSVNHRGKKKPC